MIKQWTNKRFDRWTNTRKKGQLSYVVKQTLLIGGAVCFGHLIGFMAFDDVRSWREFRLDLYVQISALLVFGLIINYFVWIINEVSYEKELKRRDCSQPSKN